MATTAEYCTSSKDVVDLQKKHLIATIQSMKELETRRQHRLQTATRDKTSLHRRYENERKQEVEKVQRLITDLEVLFFLLIELAMTD